MPSGVLDGKFALITGGSRGMGREMAIAYAKAGAAGVAITAAPGYDEKGSEIEDELNEVLVAIEGEGGKGIALLGDVAKANDCTRVVEETIKGFGTVSKRLVEWSDLGVQNNWVLVRVQEQIHKLHLDNDQ